MSTKPQCSSPLSRRGTEAPWAEMVKVRAAKPIYDLSELRGDRRGLGLSVSITRALCALMLKKSCSSPWYSWGRRRPKRQVAHKNVFFFFFKSRKKYFPVLFLTLLIWDTNWPSSRFFPFCIKLILWLIYPWLTSSVFLYSTDSNEGNILLSYYVLSIMKLFHNVSYPNIICCG